MKIIRCCIVLFICLCLGQLYAQTPDTKWYANTEADTFRISTAEELAGLAQIVNDVENGCDFSGKTIVLVNNIDLSEWGGWAPIGRIFAQFELAEMGFDLEQYGEGGLERPFSGIFDGNGKTVHGIRILNGNLSSVGLFGYVAKGVVKNVGVENVNISAGLWVGGVVGRLADGEISDCYSTGYIDGTHAGGVVGFIGDSSSVTRCYSTAQVGGHYAVGGVAGEIRGGGYVTNCYSTGIVGYERYSVKDFSPIYVGGVVGYILDGTVANCYSTGLVLGHTDIGGVVGFVAERGIVSGCAALNPEIRVSSGWNCGRVAGKEGTFSNNVAFSAMKGSFPNVKGANTINGADIKIEEILANITLDSLFTAENGWTIEKGKLPGLSGKAAEIPEHLYDNSAILVDNREILKPDSGTDVVVVAPIVPSDTSTGEFSVGPNPAGKQSGEVSFFYQGRRIKNGTLTVYDVSGNFVKKIGVSDKSAENSVRRVVASWDLRDKKGRQVSDGTYLVRGTVAAADGKRKAVSVFVGVR